MNVLLFSIPLNTATALVATIAIGIAVDDTVHHMTTYHRRFAAHGDRQRAMIETLRIEARPILYISLALAAGFLTSQFSSTSSFGLLSSLVMLLALLAELTLAPLVMYSSRIRLPRRYPSLGREASASEAGPPSPLPVPARGRGGSGQSGSGRTDYHPNASVIRRLCQRGSPR
jgi:uncharacterized membrane protein YdfJ with MMPL/SSD domain